MDKTKHCNCTVGNSEELVIKAILNGIRLLSWSTKTKSPVVLFIKSTKFVRREKQHFIILFKQTRLVPLFDWPFGSSCTNSKLLNIIDLFLTVPLIYRLPRALQWWLHLTSHEVVDLFS